MHRAPPKATDLFSCSSVVSVSLGTGRSLFSFGTWGHKKVLARQTWFSKQLQIMVIRKVGIDTGNIIYYQLVSL